MIRIVLADDHELILKGFQLMLEKQDEIQLVGAAQNGRQLLNLLPDTLPDVVVTDVQMPIMDGIQTCRIIRERYPKIPVMALSTYGDDHYVMDMFEAGAKGYLLKNTDRAELTEAIKAVHSGDVWFSKGLSRSLARLIGKSAYDPFSHRNKTELTAKEKEIIIMICNEFSNREIAERVNQSIRTIEGNREKIFQKTGVRNVAGLVVYAIKSGIYKVNT